MNQGCKVVLVGDEHQAIYRFRGADNALDSPTLVDADRLYLTNSFRFGPKVAFIANALLSRKGETRPVVGRGASDEIVPELPQSTGQYTVLHRTVMCVLETVLDAVNKNKKIFWVGGIDSYRINDLEDLYWFSQGDNSRINNKKLISDFKDYQEYKQVATDSKDPEMSRAVKILENYDRLSDRLAASSPCYGNRRVFSRHLCINCS